MRRYDNIGEIQGISGNMPPMDQIQQMMQQAPQGAQEAPQQSQQAAPPQNIQDMSQLSGEQ